MVFIGLGNKGKEYANTHHNVGFMFVDTIANDLHLTFKDESKFKASVASVIIDNKKHYLLKPLTYMNLSGDAVASFISYYNIPVDDIIIIHDDMDLPLAKIRIRKNGSAGGHNGIKSIISRLNTQQFKRIRIGIGRSNRDSRDEVIDYVLSSFSKKEKEILLDVFNKATNMFNDLINNGIDYLMNNYNN